MPFVGFSLFFLFTMGSDLLPKTASAMDTIDPLVLWISPTDILLCLNALELSRDPTEPDAPDVIANLLQQCSNLNSLDIDLKHSSRDMASIHRIGTQTIEPLVHQAANITRLLLQFVCCSDHDIVPAKAIANLLCYTPELTGLDLKARYSHINDEGVKALTTPLGSLPHLKSLSLNLEANPIGILGVDNAAAMLRNLTLLTCLHFNINHPPGAHVSPVAADALMTALKASPHPSLVHLAHQLAHSSRAPMGPHEAATLGKALSCLKNLKHVYLYLLGHAINGSGAKGLGLALSQCPDITSLTIDLSFNNIDDLGLDALTRALSPLQNIIDMKIYLLGNDISFEAKKAFIARLPQWPNLCSWDFNFYSLLQDETGSKE